MCLVLLDSDVLLTLPKLRDVASSEQLGLLSQKFIACSITFDFCNETVSAAEKLAKRETLLELIDYINTNTSSFLSDSLMRDVMKMVGANVFRALPIKNKDLAYLDPEVDEPMLDRAWPHLQLVFELFLRLVTCNELDAKLAKKYIDYGFVLKLLELFDSDDPRERDYLKTIVHRLYGKFMALRSFIRRSIQHVLFKVIYESETHNGVAQLLELLGSIINGFALPLKEEHKDYLLKALIPLHKVKMLGTFFPQLSFCMAQYVEKDQHLAVAIISSMLRCWPVSITSKQVLFLNELEETLQLTRPQEFVQVQVAVIRRLASCIASPHFQVAERSLMIWNNDHVVRLINQSRGQLFPIIVRALQANSNYHWNIAVQGLTYDVLHRLREADSTLVDVCIAGFAAKEDEDRKMALVRRQRWAVLEGIFATQTQVLRVSSVTVL